MRRYAPLVLVLALTGCSPSSRPAPDVKVERTPERVARGAYLANHIAGCVHCHSPMDEHHAPLPAKLGAGGRRFGHDNGLPGEIYSTNLTADPADGLGNWTDGEIMRAMREGVSKDGHALFPIMPYPNFRELSDEDTMAIVAYLRTLKPVAGPVPARTLDFPLSVIVNTIPKPLDGPVGPPPADPVARGAHLVKIASCADCHTPMDKGKPVEGKYLAGGHSFHEGDHDIKVPNITSDPVAGLGKWTDAQLDQAIRFGQRPDGKRLNPFMPWPAYNGLSKDDVGAMIAYLRTVPAAK